MDLGSLFGDLGFGFGPGGDSIFDRFFGQRSGRAARGADLRITLEIPLERVAEGGYESVRYSRPAVCPDCHGYGTRSGKPPKSCAACNGTGHRVQTRRARQKDQSSIRFEQISTCPECRGTGVANEEPCPKCNGSGRVEQESAVRIRIPPGIEEGATLRIPKHGLLGEPSGEPGDLYVVVYSAPDVRFQRHGADLWKAETLAVEDAVLGTKILVSKLDAEVEVKVPPGVQPDEVLRLKGKGLPRPEVERGET